MTILPLLRALLLFAALVPALTAQCTPQWQPGDPMRNVHGTVYTSVTWDPDGAGPAVPMFVVGGTFAVASFQAKVATFDGAQWAPLGNAPGDYVRTLGVFGNDLVAATPDPVTFGSSRLWRWNGSAWVQLGAPGSVNGVVNTMMSYGGTLLIGGAFSSVDGHAAPNIAKWDGASWSTVGSGVVTGVVGTVKALAVLNSQLHVAGDLSQAGGVPVAHHAIWNGAVWTPGGVFDGVVETLAVRTGLSGSLSYLLAGGAFTTVSNAQSGTVAAQHVARMQQTTSVWSALGSGLPGTSCNHLCVRATGITGYEVLATVDVPFATWKWVNGGTAWSSYGTIPQFNTSGEATTLQLVGNEYVVGLRTSDSAVQRFQVGTSGWSTLGGQGVDPTVHAVCGSGGDLVIGGTFRTISGIAVNGIARGHANAWQPLGSGVPLGSSIYALVTMPNGDIIAGGEFTMIGGVAASNIARWNGLSWAPLGAGVNAPVWALCVMPNGDLVAGGTFFSSGGVGGTSLGRIGRWDGNAWAPCGNADQSVRGLCVLTNGDLVAVGNFVTMDGATVNRIARRSNGVWQPLGAGLESYGYCVTALPGGGLVVGGSFYSVNGQPTPCCARWDGSTWQSLRGPALNPTSPVTCLATLPDGDVAVGGPEWIYTSFFPPMQTRTTLARLDLSGGGPNWSSLDVYGDIVNAVAALPDGSLAVGGSFDFAGSQISGNVAHLVPPCPALATASGNGCSGRTLTATTLPWVNATFRATGTNLPTTALVLALTSVTSVPQGVAPLAAIFAQGQPGCDVLVAPDILSALTTTNGTATSSLFLPNTPPLVGVTFFHQMIPIEVNAQGAWTSITATNALQLTAGVF